MTINNMEEYSGRIKRILINEDEIQREIKKAGELINAMYDGTPILMISILKGGFIFLADILREVNVPCKVDFMEAKSYFDDTSSSGSVAVTKELKQDIQGYHVIIIEDIIDTGRTLSEVIKLLRARQPKSLKVITLLDKPSRRIVELKADYSLFTIPDYFVIGYGLDYGEYYRNLPYIAELEEAGESGEGDQTFHEDDKSLCFE